ncbi:MAG: glycosyltransferase family 4 protein [Kiritimatiellae bacterium]|nr:glycosyltransferase family 4 protein [Kiritimatiellia bacterium]
MEHLGVNALFLIPGEVGGTQTYIVETLRAMLPMLPCRCTIFTNSECDSFLREELGDVHAPCGLDFDCLGFRARRRPSRILREQLQLPRHVRRAGCDVLWSPGYTAPLMCRARQVVSIHDMQYRRFPGDFSIQARLATHMLVTLAARRCDRVVTLSDFAKGEIVRFAGIDAGKIAVTGVGVAGSVCGGKPAKTADGAPFILSVAASYPHKNLPVLVRAFASIAGEFPHRLVIVGGRGLGEKALAAEIAASPFRGRIERRNWVSAEELAGLYAGAGLFAMPSLYEGFGIPVIEAQRAGVPVVTTRCASLPEACGKAAIYADGGDEAAIAAAMRRGLLLTPRDREALVSSGRENAARFTWTRCAERTLAAISGATGAH